MKTWIVAVAVFAALNSSAPAAERNSLPGFQQFLFGMKESDIRGLTNVGEADANGEKSRLTAAQPVEIDGTPYQLTFQLRSDWLAQIDLSREDDAAERSCSGRFEQAVGLYKGWYGDPDKPPSQSVFDGMASTLNRVAVMRRAHFSFRDGGRIRVSATYFEHGCKQFISYTKQQPAAGGGLW